MKWTIPVLIVLSAGPALAAGKFVAPKGCKVYVTVQHTDCEVSNHYRCDGDAEGDQWAVYAGQNGPFYLSKTDAETRWLQDTDLTSGEASRLASEADPASFSELLRTGLDSYDFTTENSLNGERRYQGYDHLTGKTVSIGKVRLEQTEFQLTTYGADGAVLSRRKGQQLINRDWRLFFADTEETEDGAGDKATSKSAPVSFAFPGDAGFQSMTPDIGCDMTMTEARVSLLPVAARIVEPGQ